MDSKVAVAEAEPVFAAEVGAPHQVVVLEGALQRELDLPRGAPGRELLAEGLEDRDYIDTHTENFEALKELVARYSPEVAAPICGIEPEPLDRQIAAYPLSGMRAGTTTRNARWIYQSEGGTMVFIEALDALGVPQD